MSVIVLNLQINEITIIFYTNDKPKQLQIYLQGVVCVCVCVCVCDDAERVSEVYRLSAILDF